ncbi:hypothetical protein [Synechococcus sp. CBW1107]|uniref:hypothetical protein n=1 Tax=Synechococcus sp. CBW1107 TaxID=2789857 RepID=UPI002AD53B7D|nr:hypothetical protein [Synechococcus sp. CBW1107]CAK6697525.1 Glutathione biosynthesis bifunctional protein GshAB [Synechococcus sp. CBW1107]
MTGVILRGTAPSGLHGHLDGFDQPSRLIVLQWKAPQSLLDHPAKTLSTLEHWLRDAFDVQPTTLKTKSKFSASKQGASLDRAAWHILELGKVLLQMLEVPVFHPGVIHHVRKDHSQSGLWNIRATTAVLDHFPEDVYYECYFRAARIVSFMAKTKPDSGEIAKLQSRLKRQHVDQMQGMIPRGRSTYPLLSYAYNHRIPFRHLGEGVYSLGWGSQLRRIRGGGIDKDSSIGAILSHNKASTIRVLSAAGLPVPVQRTIDSEAAALVAARELGWPVVLKPADRDRGEGVTINIREPGQLKRAWQEARHFSTRLLLERQISGLCHRLHVCDGQLISAWRRRPKSVRGDGSLTVKELIDRANAEQQALPPWKRLKPFPCDDVAVGCLAAHGLTLDSVPAKDDWAPLRPFNAPAWGGVVEDVDQLIHPDNVSLAIEAAKLFDLSNAGIDLITTDISEPWYRNGAAINEVNHSPQSPDSPQLLEKVFASHFPANGRIPIEVFVGRSAAWDKAFLKQQEYNSSGFPCWVTDHQRSVDCSGRELHLMAHGLFDRCHALLCRKNVGALIVVVSDQDLFLTGLPFDQPDHLQIVGDWQPSPNDRSWTTLLSWMQPKLDSPIVDESE